MTGKLVYEAIGPLKSSLGLGEAAADAIVDDIRVFVRTAYHNDESIVSKLSDHQIQQCATNFLCEKDFNRNHSLPSLEACSGTNFQVIIMRIIKSQCVNLGKAADTRNKKLKEKNVRRSIDEGRVRQALYPAPVTKRVGNVGWDANSDGHDYDDSDDVDPGTHPGDYGDDDFNMSAHASKTSPGPERSYSRNSDGKFAALTSRKRKAEGSGNSTKKRFMPEDHATDNAATTTHVPKGDEEWVKVIKGYLENCKDSSKYDLTKLRFEPVQQILSQSLGRNECPMPHLAIVSREARFNLRDYKDTARHTIYVLKLSIYAVDPTRPLHSTYQIVRKPFKLVAAQDPFLSWYFDHPDDSGPNIQTEIDTSGSKNAGSFLSLKIGAASLPSSQFATPIGSQIYELAGSHCTEKDALDYASVAISNRQSLSHTNRQAHSSESGVNDTVVVKLPVKTSVSQSATTPSGTDNRKNSLGAFCGTVSSKTAAEEAGRARNSMTGMITLLKDPEVVPVHGSQQPLHLAGTSERHNQVEMHTQDFTIPRLRLYSAPVPNLNQDTQSTSASSGEISSKIMTDLNSGPQPSPSPKRRAQPYTDSVIAKVAQMIAAYRQPTASSETQTTPSGSISTAGTQTVGTNCPPPMPMTLDKSMASPSPSSSTTLDATQPECTSSKLNPTNLPLQVSKSDVLCNLMYWRAKQRELSQRRDEAIIANKRDTQREYRADEERIDFVRKVLETLYEPRGVMPEV